MFGTAPYFKSLVVREVSWGAGCTMMFDESLNKALQLKQMDLHLLIWDGVQVKTRYLNSECLRYATAQDIVEQMQDMLSETRMKNLVQLSMDRPNVNWKVFDLLQSKLVLVKKSLLSIGSCGLHTLHNAFRDGYWASGWEVDHTFSMLYWPFKDSPVHREVFIKATGCDTPMLKFCQHQWVDADAVASGDKLC